MAKFFAEARKALAVAAGLAAQVVALNVAHGRLLTVLQAILGAATVAGVYGVRNADKPAPADG